MADGVHLRRRARQTDVVLIHHIPEKPGAVKAARRCPSPTIGDADVLLGRGDNALFRVRRSQRGELLRGFCCNQRTGGQPDLAVFGETVRPLKRLDCRFRDGAVVAGVGLVGEIAQHPQILLQRGDLSALRSCAEDRIAVRDGCLCVMTHADRGDRDGCGHKRRLYHAFHCSKSSLKPPRLVDGFGLRVPFRTVAVHPIMLWSPVLTPFVRFG